jgi:hypothetical protein
MPFCPLSAFKNVLGEPGKGVHRWQYFNTAIVDYVMTLLAAAIISSVTNVPLVLTTIGMLVLGMVLHMLFGVRTNTLVYLGIN